MSLSVRTTAPGDAIVIDGTRQVAEINKLKLVSARFRPEGKALIGKTFPLFLFWMQYANHQDPERNTGSGGQIEVIAEEDSRVVLKCTGTTASGSCRSAVELTIRRVETPVRYVYSVRASLDVRSEGWLVTPNPTQGEVEFANLWPEGTFSPNPGGTKQFQACYLVTPAGTETIPHHHLETSDKHNIAMKQGDKFLWLREDENPCLTVLSEEPVTAGLCAYMWDAHFAYKICREGTEVRLPAGSHFEAAYELTSIDNPEAQQIVQQAMSRPAPDLSSIPLHVPGVDRFDRTMENTDGDCRFIWPWEPEGSEQSVLALDRSEGFGDTSSLRIDSLGGTSCWKLTTLGPAYGEKPFAGRSRFQLSAYVKTSKLKGKARIAVRLHREDRGSVFDLHKYETFASDQTADGDTDWTQLKIVTPSISPAPDRIHLLLVQEGSGTSWFDNVSFEVLT